MSDLPTVSITHRFNGDGGLNRISAADLDTQLGNLAASANAHKAVTDRITGADNNLADQVVGLSQLKPEVLAGIPTVQTAIAPAMLPVVQSTTLTLARGALGISAPMDPVVTAGSLATARSAMGPWGDVTAATIDTIALLKGLSTPVSDVTYLVRGYYAAGDGGGGFYRWSSADVTTDNGGTVIQCTAGGAGRWLLLHDGTWTVGHFGAKGDGVNDDTTAIQAAINALPVGGGKVKFRQGNYLISSTLTVGDGNSTTRSTRVGVCLIGDAGAGVGEGESGTPNYGVEIRWAGATSSTTYMLSIQGPIHSCEFENLFFNCKGKAGGGIKARHLLKCKFRRVSVEQYTTLAWDLAAWDAALASGVTYGMAENLFEKITARDPRLAAAVTTAANGISMSGGWVNNVAFSRNVFVGCEFAIGGDAGTYGMFGRFIDNNIFTQCFTFWASAAVLGAGLKWTADGAFPQENTFVHCPLIGGISGSPGTGGNLFFHYPLSDSEPLPTWDKLQHLILPSGRLYGGFAGSAVLWSGGCDPGAGLGTVKKYFTLSGIYAGATGAGSGGLILACACRVSSFRVNLGAVPGGAATRIFTIRKNGVNQTLTISYNSGESGDKEVIVSPPVTFNGGDVIEVQSDVTGVPTNTGAQWSAVLYPDEVK